MTEPALSDIFEVMHSQRQLIRYRPDPVPREVIQKVLDAAVRAPNGANVQMWEFIVCDERETVSRVGELFCEAIIDAIGPEPRPGELPPYAAARKLAYHMKDVPAIVIVGADHSRGYMPYKIGEPIKREAYASSIWLAVQNLFLAARAMGLSTRLTTGYRRKEQEIKDYLGIPDHVETYVLTPLGYPVGKFTPGSRRAAPEVTSWNKFGRH